MVSKQTYAVVVVIVVVLPSVALAKEYVVGDDYGWTIVYDYEAWAAGKDFRVGDKLIFNYEPGFHNVYKVSGAAAFRDCTVSLANVPLTSGNDVITLETPGRKWYICGMDRHCEKGRQKLAITVNDTLVSVLPPPGPPSSANGIVATRYQALMVGIAAIVLMIMV
ncbi:blue copper protein 1a-like [Magnolia sinica]|uniref:blue copper protein 1a-like n=1 Tax=Magnolia sinica TaxID=86752 RepID=UPI00265A9597|nr:blue copper protein 1a-like [Magnolia sinica]